MTSTFSLRRLAKKNPSLASWFLWRFDEWQGAGTAGDYVHLGCGDRILKGFVNLDFLPHSPEVFSCNLLNIWPERLSGQLNAFYAEDVIEHFFLSEQMFILASINFLLEEYGLVRMLTPDIAQLWSYGESFDVDRLMNSGDYFADVMRCRSGIDAVNMGMRMGGHRWLHSFESFRRVAEICGFTAERTTCASSEDPKLCGINIRDESGISFAAELRKARSLRRLIIDPEFVSGAVQVEDLGQGQRLYRSTTNDPAVHYAFDTLCVKDIAVLCIRNANLSECQEHNFAKAYFLPDESGAIYIDRTLQSVPHANIFSQVDIAAAMKSVPTLRNVRFDPAERSGDYFTTGPMELFYFISGIKASKKSTPNLVGKSHRPDLPRDLADHLLTAECRHGLMAHFDFDGPIGSALDIYGEWAQNEVASILPFIPQGGHVVDVGANLGSHTLAFARAVGDQGKVLAIEPQEETFALLRHNMHINDVHAYVEPIRAAAGKENAKARITRITRTDGQNLGAVTPVAGRTASDLDGAFTEVDILTIDDLKLTELDFLKIDAEGKEVDVLLGAMRTLKVFQPVVAMECGQFFSSWPAVRLAFTLGYNAYHLRHAAFNVDNYRGNPSNIFGNAEEGMILLMSKDRLKNGRLPALPAKAQQISTPLDLTRAILSTKPYGPPEDIDTEKFYTVLMDFRRKRAEERCVSANALANRRHKSIMKLREAVSTIRQDIADIDSMMLERALEATAPIPPKTFEPSAKASWPAMPAAEKWAALNVARSSGQRRVEVDVIIPCFNNLDVTMACVYSVLSSRNDTPFDVVVVDDASPEPHLKESLRRIADLGFVTLISHKENRGFVASANECMVLHPDRHVLLLNSDTVVFNGFLDRLIAHLHAHEACGTVTPLSNNATICSYPVTERDNQAPLEISFEKLDALAGEVNCSKSVQLPTGVGFCMLIRRECLDQVGYFDEELFGKGYGEENDFCMRAKGLDWINLLAADVFVRHAGEKSFGKGALQFKESAFRKVSSRHPDYLAEVARHCATDPARHIRRSLDVERLRAAFGSSGKAVLLVGHTRGGGIERHLQDLAAYYAGIGVPVLTLRPNSKDSVCVVELNVPRTLHVPNLAFDLSTEFGEFLEVLTDFDLGHIQVHSFVDLHPQMPLLLAMAARILEVDYDFTVHDYLPVCPKVNMLDNDLLPCPGTEQWRCQACMDKDVMTTGSGRIDIVKWREAYAVFLAGAARVFAPSMDAAQRIAIAYPECADKIEIAPHPEFILPDSPVKFPIKRDDEPLRVAVIGAIGPHKGAAILEACALDAKKRNLHIEFIVIGYTDRDNVLKGLGVTITGRYKEENLFNLLETFNCHMAFFPSPWPETYCYTLSVAGLVGLFPVVFDHGAPAERTDAWGYGLRLPLSLLKNATGVNNELLSITPVAPPPHLARSIVKAGERSLRILQDNKAFRLINEKKAQGE